MNVSFASSDFQKELELLVTAIPSKPTMPVLSNILIQASDEWLRLASSDMEISIVTFCHANVVEPGTATIPAKHLLDVVRRLPGREINLVNEGPLEAAVRLTAGKYVTRIPTQNAAAYPKLPSITGLPQQTYTGNLKEMIRQVRFAISEKGKKYFMDGALFEGPRLVATDGHRMSLVGSPGMEALEDPIIIPKKALSALYDFITPNAEIIYAVDERHMFFVIDGRMLVCRRVEAKFPAYEKIIPIDPNASATVPTAYLREAFQRTVLTSSDVIMTFHPEVLTLTGRSTDIGEAMDQIDIHYEGKAGSQITLNGPSFLDFLDEAEDDQPIVMAWKDGGAILCSQGPNFRYVQMPMRTGAA